MDLAWAESLIDQCCEADVAMYMKQMGQVWARQHGAAERHGGDPAEWPAWARVREFPTPSWVAAQMMA